MISKLITVAQTREEAITKMEKNLEVPEKTNSMMESEGGSFDEVVKAIDEIKSYILQRKKQMLSRQK